MSLEKSGDIKTNEHVSSKPNEIDNSEVKFINYKPQKKLRKLRKKIKAWCGICYQPFENGPYSKTCRDHYIKNNCSLVKCNKLHQDKTCIRRFPNTNSENRHTYCINEKEIITWDISVKLQNCLSQNETHVHFRPQFENDGLSILSLNVLCLNSNSNFNKKTINHTKRANLKFKIKKDYNNKPKDDLVNENNVPTNNILNLASNLKGNPDTIIGNNNNSNFEGSKQNLNNDHKTKKQEKETFYENNFNTNNFYLNFETNPFETFGEKYINKGDIFGDNHHYSEDNGSNYDLFNYDLPKENSYNFNNQNSSLFNLCDQIGNLKFNSSGNHSVTSDYEANKNIKPITIFDNSIAKKPTASNNSINPIDDEELIKEFKKLSADTKKCIMINNVNNSSPSKNPNDGLQKKEYKDQIVQTSLEDTKEPISPTLVNNQENNNNMCTHGKNLSNSSQITDKPSVNPIYLINDEDSIDTIFEKVYKISQIPKSVINKVKTAFKKKGFLNAQTLRLSKVLKKDWKFLNEDFKFTCSQMMGISVVLENLLEKYI